MCGIYATAQPVGLTPMILQSMKHRGPDRQEWIYHGGLWVGQAMMAIVCPGIKGTEQPHVTAKQNIVAFNGEIYNYQTLAGPRTTEVELLGQMLDEGVDPRTMCDGDYAILYWQPSRGILTLYRDRFGAVPLYYNPKTIEVSSERRRLDRPVREVPAHGRVRFDMRRGTYQVDRIPHYGVVCSAVGGSDDFKEGAVVEELLLEAVRSRAQHTGSGFSCVLSGGLDSAAIVLACHRLRLKPARLITIAAFSGSEEERIAREVASMIPEANHCVITAHEAILHGHRDNILEHFDGIPVNPLRWRMAVRSYLAAMMSPTRVILCGEGSDEMWEGYPPWSTHYASTPWKLAKHQLKSVRSLSNLNLDLVNKMGMASSREYRAPFLSSTLSYFLLASRRKVGKQVLREILWRWGAPDSLLKRSKWGEDERVLDESMERVVGK